MTHKCHLSQQDKCSLHLDITLYTVRSMFASLLRGLLKSFWVLRAMCADLYKLYEKWVHTENILQCLLCYITMLYKIAPWNAHHTLIKHCVSISDIFEGEFVLLLPVRYMRMLLRSSERRRLERGVLGGNLPVKTRRKFSTVTWNVDRINNGIDFYNRA